MGVRREHLVFLLQRFDIKCSLGILISNYTLRGSRNPFRKVKAFKYNMTEETTVKTDAQTAVTETNGADETAQGVDHAAEMAAKDAEIARVREERDNYKRGMLKAKGKVDDDDLGEESTEDTMRRIAREEYLNTKEAQLMVDRKKAEEALIKENSELRLAAKNKPATTTASGSSSARDESQIVSTPAEKFFSAEQLENIKKRGVDPEAVMKNLQKRP